MTLQFGVVLIGNARWTMQAAIGGTFVALNFSYWCMALLSRKLCWNYDSIFDVTAVKGESCAAASYTLCLQAAIRASKSHEWVRASNAAPDSVGWNQWSVEALENKNDPKWDATAAMERLVLDKLPK